MGRKLSRLIAVAATFLAMGAFFAGPANAQGLNDEGLSTSDFTDEDGNFDQEAYTAALIEFQTAPILTIDGPIVVVITGCPSGAPLSAEFVGFPASKVTTVSVGDPTNITITPPADIELGFNIIRVICSAPASSRATSTIVRDVIVNLQPSGTAGVATQIPVDLDSEAGGGGGTGGGGLPVTGSDARLILGFAAATLLLGGTVVIGARRRFAGR
jgi:hypothetical protein